MKKFNIYYPNLERGILWNDPSLNIEWGLTPGEEIILSEQDRNWKTFKQMFFN